MTETPEPQSGPTATTVQLTPPKPSRLMQAAAWVVIIAGTVFTVAVIFFSGAILTHQGHYHKHYHHHGKPAPCMMHNKDKGMDMNKDKGPADTEKPAPAPARP